MFQRAGRSAIRLAERVGQYVPYAYGAALGGGWLSGIFEDIPEPDFYHAPPPEPPQARGRLQRLKRQIENVHQFKRQAEPAEISKNKRVKREPPAEKFPFVISSKSVHPVQSKSMAYGRGYGRYRRRGIGSRFGRPKGRIRSSRILRGSRRGRRMFSRPSAKAISARLSQFMFAPCDASHEEFDKTDGVINEQSLALIPGFYKDGPLNNLFPGSAPPGTNVGMYFTRNPWFFNTRVAPVTNLGGWGTADFWNKRQIHIDRDVIRYWAASRANYDQKMVVYYCKSRYNIEEDNTVNTAVTPYNRFVNGLNKLQTGNTSTTYPGNNVFSSPDFCSAFKVYKTKAYVLKPGEEITWSVGHFKPIVVKASDYDCGFNPTAVRGTCTYMQKGSKFCVAIVNGVIVTDESNPLNVALSKTSVAFRIKHSMRVREVLDNQRYRVVNVTRDPIGLDANYDVYGGDAVEAEMKQD